MKINFLQLISCIVIASIIYSCELDKDFVVGEVPTISNLTISSPTTLSCELPCTVSFTASSQLSNPANVGDQVSYTWNFGDGSEEMTGNDISHEYTVDGNYEIKLTATAPSAPDLSIMENFTVNPKSSFIATTSASDRGYDILEVSDGYIVFGYDKIFKFDKQGNMSKTVLGASFINGYGHGDFQVLDGVEDDFLLVANNGNYATVDKNLNFFDITNFTNPTQWVTAIVTQSGELRVLGGAVGGGFIDFLFYPGNYTPGINTEVYAGGISSIGENPLDLFPKHKQVDNSYYMPIFLSADNSNLLYGSDEGNTWITATLENEIQSISDGQDNDILILGHESGSMVLQKVDKTFGTLGQRIDVCVGDLPGGLLKVTDGFILVTIARESTNCLTGLTIEDDSDIRILKLDFQYNTVWDRIINMPNTQSVIEVRQATDGGFLITGTTRLNSANNLYLVKTNSEGFVD